MSGASAAALAVYAVVLAGAGVAVWRRPVVALYGFIVGLAAHNLVVALLYGAGVRGGALEAIQAWKELLLAVALASVAWAALRARQLPFRPGLVDALALLFAALVLLYAVLPQSALGGGAGAKAILYGLRHDLTPVAAYLLGRSVLLGRRELRRLPWLLVGVAALVAGGGLIDQYAVPIEWWKDSGAVGWFTEQLGFAYHGPAGLPENFVLNTDTGLYRRLVSSFLSPLATAYLLAVALLAAATPGQAWRRPRVLVPLGVIAAAGLLFTLSRSTLLAFAVGLGVLALARRSVWPAGAAVVVVAVAYVFVGQFHHIGPTTHFFQADLAWQEQNAQQKGALPEGTATSLSEPSLQGHWAALKAGLATVRDHPQGFGLGNAGSNAVRFGVKLQAGESTYTEIGVETGVPGLAVFVAWCLALLGALVVAARRAGDDEGRRWLAGTAAASFAAVLAIAVQTDAVGVPWLAIVLWWVAGAAVARGSGEGVAGRPTRAAG